MRFSLSLFALLAASPAFAEDFVVRADVAEAVVYAGVAEVVRRAELDLEPGTHRILFPGSTYDSLPVIRVSSGELGEIERISDVPIEEGALDTNAQAAARAELALAEAAFEAAMAELDAASGAVRAAELQQAYLQSIVRGGEAGVAMPEDAAALAAILATLGTEMTNAGAALHDAVQAQTELRQTVADRQEEFAAAQAALSALSPYEGSVDLWAVTLEVTTAGTVTLEIDDFDNANWAPVYDAHLDSETGALRLERSIALYTESAWQDVAVVLSTSDPSRPLSPTAARPSRASIFDPQPASRSSGLLQLDMMSEAEVAAAPIVEPVVIVEDTGIAPIVEGLAISYPYPDPVSSGVDGNVFLPFGAIALEADLINRAVPRWDSTAFLIAEFENSSGEPILPGEARFFRDGALIGASYVDLIPAGAEWQLDFGPLDHIQLEWTDLSRDTGDRGVFVSSNVEDRRVLVTAENLSGEPVTLELLYATPFSEQEDLEIEVSASLAPDETAWEDLRGVFAWDLELAPGGETEITMQFEFDWPDDMMLDWRP